MITYEYLTYDSFERKLKSFGITIKNRKEIEKYASINLLSDDAEYVTKVCNWCEERFGDNWIWSNTAQRLTLYFEDPADATAFILRWSV